MAVIKDDPFGDIKLEKGKTTPSPQDVNAFHARSDADASQSAQHHSIGIKHNQAAAGDHIHDSKSSRKVGYALGLSISGAKGGNAALASLIAMLGQVMDFTDNTTP